MKNSKLIESWFVLAIFNEEQVTYALHNPAVPAFEPIATFYDERMGNEVETMGKLILAGVKAANPRAKVKLTPVILSLNESNNNNGETEDEMENPLAKLLSNYKRLVNQLHSP